MHPDNKPVVLCFSGADPTGGAGIQADIEAIASQGTIATTVITAITVQDTISIHDYKATEAKLVKAQANAVLEDSQIACIKIGMLASVENAEVISEINKDYPEIPIVLDPVFASNTEASLSTDQLPKAVKELLLPICTIITPNINEALALASNADNAQDAAASLLETGCANVLLTGTHADTEQVTHTLYNRNNKPQQFNYERLPHEYHGSGCTLAASIAALIAHGVEMDKAVQSALDYTYQTLLNARQIGKGQLHPNRFFWTESD